MTTTILNHDIRKTGRPLNLLDVLSKIGSTVGQIVLPQPRSAEEIAIAQAASLRRMADRHRAASPSFAADLYAAADHHELING